MSASFVRHVQAYWHFLHMINRRVSVYGLRRSGNHAVIGWMAQNIGQSNDLKQVIDKVPLFSAGECCYINSVTEFPRHFETIFNFATIAYPNVIITHEDCFSSFEVDCTKNLSKVIIVRDILNVVASRYKALVSSGKSDFIESGNLLSISEQIFEIWLDHASPPSGNKIIIQFEHWVKYQKYRTQICNLLRCQDMNPINTITSHGGGSSFSKMERIPTHEELISRWEMVDLPEKFLKRIQASDIQEARRRLGYCL
ncbi:hypothetical protein N9C84_01250 [Desulfobacterales bacterium]|nr:hypothetical protein [Desulfobacterales bacterium]